MSHKTAYLLATWGGARNEPGYDAARILRRHIQQLDEVLHDVQVVLIVPKTAPPTSPEFSALIGKLERRKDIIVIHRENKGYSYGSYSCAYEQLRGQFERWIFHEDDYLPIGDNFDDVWNALLTLEGPEVGLLAGKVFSRRLGPHAAISISAATSASMEKVRGKFGFIPHADPKGKVPAQVHFSRAFLGAGLKLQDIVGHGYRAPFWNSRVRKLIYHDEFKYESGEGPHLYFPAQAFDRYEEALAKHTVPIQGL